MDDQAENTHKIMTSSNISNFKDDWAKPDDGRFSRLLVLGLGVVLELLAERLHHLVQVSLRSEVRNLPWEKNYRVIKWDHFGCKVASGKVTNLSFGNISLSTMANTNSNPRQERESNKAVLRTLSRRTTCRSLTETPRLSPGFPDQVASSLQPTPEQNDPK